MRFTPLLALPLIVVWSDSLTSSPHVVRASGRTSLTADGIPVSVRWNRLVPRLVDEAAARRRAARTAATGDSAALRRLAQTSPPILLRIYALLGVAQLAAANSAHGDRAVSSDAAVASASAAVLTTLFPDSAVRASIAQELARDLTQAGSGSLGAERARSGRRMGENVAKRVISAAPPALDLVAAWNGTVPVGPGRWHSAPGIPPIGTALATARAWLLDSASQFRPAPPPAYGTPQFDAALEEVRRVSRQLTPQQVGIARRWNAGDPWAVWNDVASAALIRHHASDVEAARVLAVLNVAASDAMIACFEAKYHYWTIRPSQADTTLTLPDSIGLPNFPSFPSGHACSAGAFDAVLGHYLPQERAEFARMAEEQAMSRLYGGIHYRFDNDGGLALGRIVARYAIEREQSGGLSAWRAASADRKR
jgi:PAP2 superfamily